ncbi:MAG: deoxyribodipyrimidine photo-lyase [Bacteroidota bacterium]|nr:deoxyribodipyrimidine photo-lyase [Bacteroidota bacterium]
MNNQPISIFWFRRDLRLEDNAGLYYALKSPFPVLPIFIFDTHILQKLEDKHDARVEFIHQSLQNIQSQLAQQGSTLHVFIGKPEEIWTKIIHDYEVKMVFANQDYEPYAIKRDHYVKDLLTSKNISFQTFKDQCIFEYKEVLKDDQKPYTVYTPYSKKWKTKLNPFYLKPYPNKKYFGNFLKINPIPIPTLSQIGFSKTSIIIPPSEVKNELLLKYSDHRDFPAISGTSRLGIHLRFGTVSIRELASLAFEKSPTFLNELIWRDFYMMILSHFPHVVNQSFKKEYDRIEWRNNPDEFEAWCTGNTGYPIVDAGMRELNATGFMHNRVRMITASFLTKHLLIDWRWGEAYFAKKLLDYDLSANNGGWQWAAGSGCDAAPYFRIFNPSLQMQKFDPQLKYIGTWVPEYLSKPMYVVPIVNHEFARKRVLEVYQKGLKMN